jgi:hypothetical protein
MMIQYLVIVLILVGVFFTTKQKVIRKRKKIKQHMGYWIPVPGHLTSRHYPFDVPLRFRRHHRFHRMPYKKYGYDFYY